VLVRPRPHFWRRGGLGAWKTPRAPGEEPLRAFPFMGPVALTRRAVVRMGIPDEQIVTTGAEGTLVWADVGEAPGGLVVSRELTREGCRSRVVPPVTRPAGMDVLPFPGGDFLLPRRRRVRPASRPGRREERPEHDAHEPGRVRATQGELRHEHDKRPEVCCSKTDANCASSEPAVCARGRRAEFSAAFSRPSAPAPSPGTRTSQAGCPGFSHPGGHPRENFPGPPR